MVEPGEEEADIVGSVFREVDGEGLGFEEAVVLRRR